MKEISFGIKIPNFFLTENFVFYLKTALSCLGLIFVFFFYDNLIFSLAGSAIFLYFWLAIIWRISERFSLILAIICLISTVISMILKNDDWADNLSKYLYYFLVISTIQIILDGLLAKKSQKSAVRPVDNSPRQPKRKLV